MTVRLHRNPTTFTVECLYNNPHTAGYTSSKFNFEPIGRHAAQPLVHNFVISLIARKRKEQSRLTEIRVRRSDKKGVQIWTPDTDWLFYKEEELPA